MTTFCLELRSTADWSDIRYRDYTTSSAKAERFRNIPKIQFTDSGHGIVPSVGEGRQGPRITLLDDYVRQHMRAA